MPTVYISFGNPRHIYFRIARAYIKRRIKKPTSWAFFINSNFSGEGKTVSNTKFFFSSIHHL